MTGYLHRIRDAVRMGVIPQAAVVSVEVEHGPGCRAHLGRRCICHPRITAVVDDHVLVIGSGGAVLERSKRQ